MEKCYHGIEGREILREIKIIVKWQFNNKFTLRNKSSLALVKGFQGNGECRNHIVVDFRNEWN